jgi:serine/threonine protein kinase
LFEKDDDSVKGTVGSMRYFSPEIVRTGGPKIVKGRSSDVWALAVTLYNMASNKFPFTSLNVVDFKTELIESEPDYSVIKDERLCDLLRSMFTKD